MEWLGSHLLRSARPFVPNIAVGNSPLNGSASTEDDQAMMQMMCDLVLGELQVEINRVEKEAEHRRHEERRLVNQPDYSWLMDWRLRAKRPLGFQESSEVEKLCAKVRPAEWRRLLREWRTRVRFVESREEVLGTFREAVDELTKERMGKVCSVESVDEQQQYGEIELMKGTAIGDVGRAQKRRPQTARNIYAATPLSVFALTLTSEEENGNM